jgi:hypothetical protein
MKRELRSALLCLGVFIMAIFGCQKQDQPVKPSAISSNENKSNGVNEGIGHTFDNTFTKYINNYPFMAGIVGGDVGTGTYAGEVLNLSVTGDIMSVEALYHFNGGVHSFTAHVFVTENDAPGVGTATITGQVTEGWLKGANVTGEYKVWTTCPIPTPGNEEGTKCYQGMIHIHVPKG